MTKEIDAALGLGRRGQQRPGRRGPDPPGRPLQDRHPLRHEAAQGLGRGRAGQPGLARLLPALQGPARAVLRAGADLQRRDEGRWSRRAPPSSSIEDLGAWLPLFTENDDDYKWIADVIPQCVDGVDAKIAWHFCYGNAWGNRLAGLFPAGYEAVLPHFYDLPIDQFVLDFANRDMVDIDALKSLPADKEVAIGVIDVRTSMIETPEEIADADPQGDRGGAAGAGLPDHRLRHEAARAHRGADEAEGAGRGCADRAGRARVVGARCTLPLNDTCRKE